MWLWALVEPYDLNEGWVDWDTGLLKVLFISPSGQIGTGVTNVIFAFSTWPLQFIYSRFYGRRQLLREKDREGLE